jgi:hypothetical protein
MSRSFSFPLFLEDVLMLYLGKYVCRKHENTEQIPLSAVSDKSDSTRAE